ncbi:putative F-box protein At1g46984 [Papaver somniferum]|uniref:putative F-box protein At1g46984 n=1 Tax=Papaver somniferum TaxID=3469 RepID=UPI000E6F8591|nr:putative F-box protein At1g46984 [Papaver somniferum]
MNANPYPNYAFGFDPLTGKHKVLCMWEISRYAPWDGNGMVHVKVDISCEVFTVGENKWRKLDDVPPVVKLHGRPVYANGSIYIRNSGLSDPPGDELILAFDVGTEKFRVIEIPTFIVKYSATSRESCSFLGEYFLQVDGYMALLDRVDEDVVKLWISDDSCSEKKRTTKWTEETILLPFPWGRGCPLDVTAVEGTNQLIITSPTPGTCLRSFVSLYIYDRVTKSSQKIDITGIVASPLLMRPYGYDMFIYHESLVPVHQKPAAEEIPDQTCSFTTGLKME